MKSPENSSFIVHNSSLSIHNSSLSAQRSSLARQWISYAVGIVMDRFQPGIENALGRGRFPEDVSAKLRELADPDGILVMDEGHSDDLPTNVLQALNIMFGDSDSAEIIKAATGKEGNIEGLLRQYLERTFFKLHIQQYRKRPVYWLLQSPKKRYGVWVFHERLNKDSLFRISTEYVEPKINLLESRIKELRNKRDTSEGREKRAIEKEMDALIDTLEDVREFKKRLDYITKERGYVPHIDDGVLLNMAPLWELIWSHQAMDHWPERVKEKCKTNKSYAIAHGLDDQ
ncbi:MAG: hypothetical protein JRI51_11565 [Deltaproteobacteria bacterium]|nr:hypothetical protein [Deltaproteobacteria bacterium]